MDDLYNSYGALLVPAGTVRAFSMTASEFIRIVSCPSFGVLMKIDGETESPIYAGLEFRRGNEKGRFARVEFKNTTAAPVTVKFFHGLGLVKDSSFYIFDPLASAIVIRRSEGIQHTASVSVLATGNLAALLVAANEATDYAEISNDPENLAIRVGNVNVGSNPESGVLIKPGESRKFYTRGALYAISNTDADAGAIGVTRFFF